MVRGQRRVIKTGSYHWRFLVAACLARRKQISVDPTAFQQMMASRLCSRMSTIPGHNLRIDVTVLWYSLYKYIFRFFELVPGSRKSVSLEGTCLEHAIGGLEDRLKNGEVVVRETRTATLGQGRGRGLQLVGRRVQVRWTLRGSGFHWFEATVTKERSGSIYVKYHADGAEDWVSFPDPACRLMEVQSSALEDMVAFQNLQHNKVGFGGIGQYRQY